jgi:hypothetical protein
MILLPLSWRAVAMSCVLACAGTVSVFSPPVLAAPALDGDVLIQAGHEGRPDCGPPPGGEPPSLCHNTGARGEIRWTPVVADEATRALRAAGIHVLRVGANLEGRRYRVRDALFLHFDGSTRPCATGASIGYPTKANGWTAPAASAGAGAAWKALYGRFIPFRFERDNFTSTLRRYYGFKHVAVSDAALVIEGGELTCPAQREWLQTKLRWEGDLLAYFVATRLGRNVPLPSGVPAVLR